MPTILLAWELGGGLGHVIPLSRVARRLLSHGMRVVAAVKELTSARVLTEAGAEVLQAPIWPVTFLSEAERARMSSATFADSLADAGLANSDALAMLLRAWQTLLTWLKPDLIVADYAPAASLAARGRAPLVLTGGGFYLPPAGLRRFPLLHDVSPPVWSEDEILTAVNRALRSTGGPELGRLAQIFAGDAEVVSTFPLLDPYRAQRQAPAVGPFLEHVPLPRRPDAHKIFVYLTPGSGVRADLEEMLLFLAPRLRIFAPAASRAFLTEAARAGAAIDTVPPALSETLSSTRLIVHHGGMGVAAEALAAGVPQLVLSLDIEKELNGRALEAAGVGQLIKFHDPAARVSADAVTALAEDEILALRAEALGEPHRRMLRDDPLDHLVQTCLTLL